MLLKLGIALLVVALCAASLFGYRAYTRHRDLTETLQWMDQTYNPHEGGENYGRGHGDETHCLRNTKLQTEDITEEFHQTFAYKGDCTVVMHHDTVPVGVFRNVYTVGDHTFSLIPTSVDAYAQKGEYVLSRDVDVVTRSGSSQTMGYGADRQTER
jgi:hypothetical protein